MMRVVAFRKRLKILIVKGKISLKRGDTEIEINGKEEPILPEDTIEEEVDEENGSQDDLEEICIEEENELSHFDVILNRIAKSSEDKDMFELENAFQSIDYNEVDEDEKNKLKAAYLSVKSSLGCKDSLNQLVEICNMKFSSSVDFYNLKVLGISYGLLGAIDKQIEVTRKIIEKIDDIDEEVKFTVELTSLLRSNGKEVEAENILLKYLKDNSNLSSDQTATIYSDLAKCYKVNGEMESLTVALCASQMHSPSDTDVLFSLGYNLPSEHNDLKLSSYELSISIDPNSFSSKNNVANIYGEFELLENKMKLREELKNREPLYAANISFDYLKIGKYQEAYELLKSTMKEENVNKNVMYYLNRITELRTNESKKIEEVRKSAKIKLRDIQSVSNLYFSEFSLSEILNDGSFRVGKFDCVKKDDKDGVIISWFENTVEHELRFQSNKAYGKVIQRKMKTKNYSNDLVMTKISEGYFIYNNNENVILCKMYNDENLIEKELIVKKS